MDPILLTFDTPFQRWKFSCSLGPCTVEDVGALKRRDKNQLSEDASSGGPLLCAWPLTTTPGSRHVIASHSCMNLSLTTIDHEYTNYPTTKVIVPLIPTISSDSSTGPFQQSTSLPRGSLCLARLRRRPPKARASSVIPTTPPHQPNPAIRREASPLD